MNQQVQEGSYVTKIQGPGTTLMKVSGILMIIFGAIGTLLQLISSAGISMVSASIQVFADQGMDKELEGITALLGGISSAYLIATVASVVTLVTGILAVVLCRKLDKGMPALIFAAIAIVLTLVFNIYFFSTVGKIAEFSRMNSTFESLETSFKFGFSNILSILASIVLPVLVILGVIKNKKAA